MKKTYSSFEIYSILLINLISLTILILPKITFSQVQQEWSRRYNSPSNLKDQSGSIAMDKSGNVYVTGTSVRSGSIDIVTIKYLPTGIQRWTDIYNVNAYAEIVKSVTDANNNLYISAFIGNLSSGLVDMYLFKYDSSGTLLWYRDYGDGNIHYFIPQDLVIDKEGSIYEAGNTNNNSTGESVIIVKYNPTGDTLWSKIYKPTGYYKNNVFSIATDSSSNLVIAGACITYNGAAPDCIVTEYNSSGIFKWSNVYNSGGYGTMDIFEKVGVDNNGYIYATGIGGVNGDYLTIKYNTIGDQQWLRRYNAGGTNGSTSITIDNTSNIFITGESTVGSSNLDFATIKYNSNGDSLWVRRYDNPSNQNDEAFDIIKDYLGNIYVNGMSMVNGVYNFTTIKYDNNGVQKWIMQHPGTPIYRHSSIVVDNLFNVYVSGDSGAGNTQDFITIKYSQLVGINNTSSEIIANYNLEQNYPNPFNPVTTITFTVPDIKTSNGNIKLEIFDITGKKIETLIDRKMNPGLYKISWDGSIFSSGIYFYKLSSVNYSETRKMILIK
jgi:hypothetical protein